MSDDFIIYSTTSPLHRFYYINFASVRSFDLIPAASAVFIDYITLPLRGNPIHIVCDIPADRQQLQHALIRMEVLYTAGSLYFQSGSAGSKIIGPNTSHLRCDIKMPRREFNNFKKLKKENDILKIIPVNSKATLHKHPIYTLESSKHPSYLVRLSL